MIGLIIASVLGFLSDTDVRGIAIVCGVFTLLIKQWRNDKVTTTAAEAAQQALAQLRNNGGQSALDKIQLGHLDIVQRLDAQAERLDAGGERFSAIERRLEAIAPNPTEQAAKPPG